MARTQKLKVYRTPAGFYDAYVAAPSQKAALRAWGSDGDLFARGLAEIVTDPALSAEPLASPGVVVRHSRGTTAEQIAAMPEPEAKPKPGLKNAVPSGPQSSSAKKAVRRRAPKPSTTKRDAAEEAIDTIKAEYDRKSKAIAERETELARERRELEREKARALEEAENHVRDLRRAYDTALRKWRG